MKGLAIWFICPNNSDSLYIYRGISNIYYAWIYFNEPSEYPFYLKGDIKGQ